MATSSTLPVPCRRSTLLSMFSAPLRSFTCRLAKGFSSDTLSSVRLAAHAGCGGFWLLRRPKVALTCAFTLPLKSSGLNVVSFKALIGLKLAISAIVSAEPETNRSRSAISGLA
ncbi:hypothetical protein D3C72_2198370 [compost metagenome]